MLQLFWSNNCAGEKISSRDKTIIVDEFKDIELQKEGILKVQATTEDYQYVLSKKKELTIAQEMEKLMLLDAQNRDDLPWKTAEDVHYQMQAIQENEIRQL
ncbi:hypothetical protein EDB19DRAFT_1828410 [Suillus lakei]|nr:hypothetical protein EDB19DRAFT_1828410 [Suillus lakei]